MRQKVTIFSLLLISLMQSKPPLEELSKAQTPFILYNLYFLSPLHGAVGAEGNFLKKIWLYRTDQNSVVKLLKTLFIVEEGNEFLATSYQPYCRFTPQTLSLLISKAYNDTLFIKDEENNFSIIQELTKTFKGPGNPKRLANLIEHIQGSFYEENNCLVADQKNEDPLHIRGTTFQILLAFLYLKSDTIHDLQSYTNHMFNYLELNHNEHLSEPNIDETFQSSYEQLITQKLIEKMLPGFRPPSLCWKRKVIYNTNKPISNCCETAIREIINNILYNPQTKSFDLSRLPAKVQKSLPKSICTFYQKHSSAHNSKDSDSQQTHEDWMFVVSNVPNVDYRKKDHEIDPSLLNIMYCISAICGVEVSKNKYLAKKNFVKKICKRLSNNNVYTLKIKNIHYDDTAADITFKLTDLQNTDMPIHFFTLHIRKDHAWIKHAPAPIVPHSLIEHGSKPITIDYLNADQIREILKDSPVLHASMHDLATLYAPYLVESTQHIPALHTTMLLSLPTETDQEKRNCFTKLFSAYKNSQNPMLYKYMLGIIRTVSYSPALRHCLLQMLYRYYSCPFVKQVVQEKYQELHHNDQETLLIFGAQRKLWKDPFYEKIIIDILMKLRNFEYNPRILFDSKVFILQQLILNKAYKNKTVEIALDIHIDFLSEERLERFKKGLQYAQENYRYYNT